MTTTRSRPARWLPGALLVGVLATLGPAATATATPHPAPHTGAATLALPAPTGRYPVGTDKIALTDASRTDPWVPASGARRVVSTFWYPTNHRTDHPAPYVTATASAAILAGENITTVPADSLSTVATHASVGTVPLPGRRPLVVLTPGFGMPASSLTGLGEDLASNGYLVAAIDHNYESFATTFPNGDETPCVACDSADSEKVIAGRAADVSFVLDRLTARHSAWRWGSRIDASRIAMVGHSIGGAATSAAMVADPRIDAGVNMDGTPFAAIPAGGLSRPFLMLGSVRSHAPGLDPHWDDEWAHLSGWRRWFTVTDSVHFSFMDYTVLADQLGLPVSDPGMSGARSMDITRTYVRAFLDRSLLGYPEPILDHPSAHYPEVNPEP